MTMSFSKKRIHYLVIVAIIVLLCDLLIGGIIAVNNDPSVQLKREMNAFSLALEQEDLDGMRLKIYYSNPSVLYYAPLTLDQLISNSETQEIIVDNEQLIRWRDVLQQLEADSLIPVRETSFLDARVCYIFETKDSERILEVAAYGRNGSVFVNEVEVEYSVIFPTIACQFVDNETMETLFYLFNGLLYLPDDT